MKFGATPVADAIGGIAVHAVRHDGLVLKKGQRVSAADVAALQGAGVEQITLGQLEDGDIGEDAAAQSLAQAIAGANVRVGKPFTGRSNLFSQADGVLCVDAALIDAINDVNEAVTVATLPRWRRVVAGEMIGTVKIIPFAIADHVLNAAVAAGQGDVLSVSPFQPLRLGVVATLLPGLKPATIKKTMRVLRERVAPAGALIVADVQVEHETQALAKAIKSVAPQCDIVIVFGASAITDRRDVIPAALTGAGGQIEHFGMPVDPGNLLLVGRVEVQGSIVQVLGAPGCARSPKENGFDWVLYRMLAGIDVTAADIKKMGVGGLLMEIVDRGQLRDPSAAGGSDA